MRLQRFYALSEHNLNSKQYDAMIEKMNKIAKEQPEKLDWCATNINLINWIARF